MPTVRTREEFQQAMSAAILDNTNRLFFYRVQKILKQASCSFGEGQIQPTNKRGSYCRLARARLKNIRQKAVPEVNATGHVFPEKTAEGAIIPNDCWDCVSIAYAIPALNQELDGFFAT
jgi:hypothetical protein